MNHFIDAWLSPGVWLLAGWSLRWGIFIVLVAFWFAVRRPRHAATRDVVWRTVLVAGLLLLPSGAGLVVLIKPSTPAVQPVIPTTADTKLERQGPGADPAPSPPVRDRGQGHCRIDRRDALHCSEARRTRRAVRPVQDGCALAGGCVDIGRRLVRFAALGRLAWPCSSDKGLARRAGRRSGNSRLAAKNAPFRQPSC